MNLTWIIFKKELRDITRDRRTIITMIIVPILLFPVLMTIATSVTSSQKKKAREKVLEVALVTHGNASAFRESLLVRSDLKLLEDISETEFETLIQSDSLDAAIRFDVDFDTRIQANQTGEIHLHFKSYKDRNAAQERLRKHIDKYRTQLLEERFQQLDIDQNVTQVIKTHRHDVASQQEKFGKTAGGFIPYIFILFCFTGCMYPAIDLGAGEKERGTMETLLVSPASRLQILLGKIGVIILSGLISACVTFLGLVLAVIAHPDVAAKILSTLSKLIAPTSIAAMLIGIAIAMITISLLLLPLATFFASALMSISIFARSFKEAQSQMTPMTFVVILPVFIGILPGIELNALTALIPVLNVSLATKEMIAGTITPFQLIEVYGSLIALAAAGIYFCMRWFEREDIIFREG